MGLSRIWLIGGFLIVFSAVGQPAPAEVGPDPCAPFYQELEAVPHESIFQREGPFTSLWFGAGAVGCEVVMVTSESRLGEEPLPDLDAAPGTPLHLAGWRRNPRYIADGAGSRVVGLEQDDTLCLVYTDQPAWFDETGAFVQSAHITVKVQCMAGAHAPAPHRKLREDLSPKPAGRPR